MSKTINATEESNQPNDFPYREIFCFLPDSKCSTQRSNDVMPPLNTYKDQASEKSSHHHCPG